MHNPLDDLPTREERRPKATYLYFKPTGKWKYEGFGATIPVDGIAVTHERLLELNDGHMPGISSLGYEYTIVVIDPSSQPRMIPAKGVFPTKKDKGGGPRPEPQRRWRPRPQGAPSSSVEEDQAGNVAFGPAEPMPTEQARSQSPDAISAGGDDRPEPQRR